MKILVIDDDRVFTEPLLWKLCRKEHDVCYCNKVGEVLHGWYQFTDEFVAELGAALGTSPSPSVLLDPERRYPTRELMASDLAARLGQDPLPADVTAALDLAHRDPLDPVPDVVIADIRMPCGRYYSRRETRSGSQTGVVLIRDVLVRIPRVPVIVVTVDPDPTLRADLMTRFPDNLKRFMLKPATPTEVLGAMSDVFSA